ncbi:MAG: flagellar hook capping FlgD N-terminal domain-containing protein [Planctomycetota bacterium]
MMEGTTMSVTAVDNTMLDTYQSSKSKKSNDLGTNQFLEVLVAEISHQDPMAPMDNQNFLTQLSQMRSLETTEKLNSTLSSLVLQQTLGSAAGLIGRSVVGSGEAGDIVAGQVDRVTVEDGAVFLWVEGNRVPMTGVTEVF